jgi:hypothetical protein
MYVLNSGIKDLKLRMRPFYNRSHTPSSSIRYKEGHGPEAMGQLGSIRLEARNEILSCMKVRTRDADVGAALGDVADPRDVVPCRQGVARAEMECMETSLCVSVRVITL